MSPFKLTSLIIKPTLRCTANCPTCAGRKELHKSMRQLETMTLEDWKRVLAEAHELGVQDFDISGGEPTLFKDLHELIRIGRGYGWRININTNGSLITEALAESLIAAGLNTAQVSLYSPDAAIQDKMRGTKGLWKKAVRAIQIFSQLEEKNPHFSVRTQTLLSRDNYRDFAELIELHYEAGSNFMATSYLEGDFEKRYLLNEQEIDYFKETIIPRLLDFCNRRLSGPVQQQAIKQFSSYFSTDLLTKEEWASGCYRPARRRQCACPIPQQATIILANGDVHPCNIVEYAHEPVMGNVLRSSLKELWTSEKWNSYRATGHEKCELCPMNLHGYVYLRDRLLPRQESTFQRWERRIKSSPIYPVLEPGVKLIRVFRKLVRNH